MTDRLTDQELAALAKSLDSHRRYFSTQPGGEIKNLVMALEQNARIIAELLDRRKTEVQKPIAWLNYQGGGKVLSFLKFPGVKSQPLYAAPQPVPVVLNEKRDNDSGS